MNLSVISAWRATLRLVLRTGLLVGLPLGLSAAAAESAPPPPAPPSASLIRSCAATAVADAVYAPYAARAARQVASLAAAEGLELPPGLDWAAIPLSTEDREALASGRPPSMAAAARLPGVTPAGLLALLAHVRRRERKAA